MFKMKAVIVTNQRQRTLLFYKVSRWPLMQLSDTWKHRRLYNMTTDETLHQTNCTLALATSINLPDTSPTAFMKVIIGRLLHSVL
uniref:Uncharacterized protein n=1 Tax=Glossina pallidipes TaxID=7398 RepID=A0A1B0A831_GLOPL